MFLEHVRFPPLSVFKIHLKLADVFVIHVITTIIDASTCYVFMRQYVAYVWCQHVTFVFRAGQRVGLSKG